MSDEDQLLSQLMGIRRRADNNPGQQQPQQVRDDDAAYAQIMCVNILKDVSDKMCPLDLVQSAHNR